LTRFSGGTVFGSSPDVGSQTEKMTSFFPLASSWMPKYPRLNPHAQKYVPSADFSTTASL
jgi:hypothetical protein